MHVNHNVNHAKIESHKKPCNWLTNAEVAEIFKMGIDMEGYPVKHSGYFFYYIQHDFYQEYCFLNG